MTISQLIFFCFAVSLPLVVLAVIGRQLLSAYRSIQERRMKHMFYSILAIAGMLLLFAGLAVMWFGYGVSHGSKDIWSDLLLMAISVFSIYGAGYGLWRLARYFDAKHQLPG